MQVPPHTYPPRLVMVTDVATALNKRALVLPKLKTLLLWTVPMTDVYLLLAYPNLHYPDPQTHTPCGPHSRINSSRE